jgi:hypothetical protein
MSDSPETGAAEPLAQGQPTAAPGAPLLCVFDHPFFAWFQSHGGGQFGFDEISGGGAFHAQIGEHTRFTLPLGPLARELGLNAGDAADVTRLRMTAEAVNYVESLALGAELPAEVISGRPSWPLPERYLPAAKFTLTRRITVWATGIRDAGIAVGVEALSMLAALEHDEATLESRQHKLRTDGLVEALGYIDCLRDRSTAALSVLAASAAAATNLLPARSEASSAAAGLQRVIGMADKRISTELASAAAEPADIAAALAEPEATCAGLAEWRNRLYVEVRRLEAATRPWKGKMLAADAATKELVFRTYRLMGRRDLPAERWQALEARLAAALLPPGKAYRHPEPHSHGAPWSRMIWTAPDAPGSASPPEPH